MRVLPLLLLAACGAGADDSPSPSDGSTDAPPGCITGISHEVSPPFSAPGTVVRAAANVQNSSGQHTYQWFLSFNGGPNQTPAPASLDNSQVEFPAEAAGVYRVRYRIEDPNCAEASEQIDVNEPGVGTTVFRVHVVAPPAAERPPVSKLVPVEGGTDDLVDDVQLAAGTVASGSVLFQGSPVEAYLKFIPTVGADAVVETYSDAGGSYTAGVRSESHSVLVVPTDPAITPQLVAWTPGVTTLALEPGVAVTGSVLGPQGAALANTRVQLTIDGVPSAIGLTDSAGDFSLAAPASAGKVRFEITPPTSLGLPRLVAEAQFSVATSMVIQYAANLATTRDLAGTTVQRAGALPNASVSIVGTLPAAGTIVGSNSITAVGEVRFTATTNGAGVLPTLRVPAKPLDAVIFPNAPGDHAVTSIDLTTAVPATITAAATITKSTQLTSSTGTGLPGAILDAVPTGALALAGAPAIRRVAGTGGNLTVALAPNASYTVRLTDPNGNGTRGALAKLPNQTTANLPATLALTRSTKVTGLVVGSSPIPGAIVQFLCADAQCIGIDRSRPIAEGVTGIDGTFSLALPDS